MKTIHETEKELILALLITVSTLVGIVIVANVYTIGNVFQVT